MLTRQQVVEQIKAGEFKSACWFDGRDFTRLADFLPLSDWDALGVGPAEGADLANYEPKPWTEEAIIAQMKDDVAFGFEKGLNQRGLSAGAMWGVVCMWLRILEDELYAQRYAQYGLPLFKAVAVKYGFDNPIGDDDGSEQTYASGE